MRTTINPEVFREYDVRGVVDRDLNPDFVYHLGRAIGTYAARQEVRSMTLGGDCRLSSPAYREAIGRGLVDSGILVTDIGLCATPMLYFSIRHFSADGGVMVTGSHNPPDFNGFKICIGPDTIYGDEIQALRRLMEVGDFVSGDGALVSKAIASDYENYLLNHVRIRPGLHVVLDGGNGVGGHFAVPLLKRYGCRVTELFCVPDGQFPNHFPDPTIPENLQELIRLVIAEKADIGIAYDGDADRIGIVTDQGDVLWGDELLLLFSRFILKANPDATIIGEVKCSQTLYDDIAAHGGQPIMWKAGHSLIKGKMKEAHALLAGEMSGHIFFADRYFGYDDAIYASLRLLEILSETGKRIGDLLADVPKTFTTPEIRVDCPDGIKFGVVETAREHFSKTHAINAIDGVRISFGDGWGLIRASNTQPVLVLRFEANSPERLTVIRQTVEGVLDRILRNT
jgi:phosphomannomutase/phosphoglucomutase